MRESTTLTLERLTTALAPEDASDEHEGRSLKKNSASEDSSARPVRLRALLAHRKLGRGRLLRRMLTTLSDEDRGGRDARLRSLIIQTRSRGRRRHILRNAQYCTSTQKDALPGAMASSALAILLQRSFFYSHKLDRFGTWDERHRTTRHCYAPTDATENSFQR